MRARSVTALEHSGVCSLEQVYLDEDEQYHEARVYEDEGGRRTARCCRR